MQEFPAAICRGEVKIQGLPAKYLPSAPQKQALAGRCMPSKLKKLEYPADRRRIFRISIQIRQICYIIFRSARYVVIIL